MNYNSKEYIQDHCCSWPLVLLAIRNLLTLSQSCDNSVLPMYKIVQITIKLLYKKDNSNNSNNFLICTSYSGTLTVS